ncbi:MAG: hypothetical protein AABY22_21435, partial [Nanoarchaeota archaeon]
DNSNLIETSYEQEINKLVIPQENLFIAPAVIVAAAWVGKLAIAGITIYQVTDIFLDSSTKSELLRMTQKDDMCTLIKSEKSITEINKILNEKTTFEDNGDLTVDDPTIDLDKVSTPSTTISKIKTADPDDLIKYTCVSNNDCTDSDAKCISVERLVDSGLISERRGFQLVDSIAEIFDSAAVKLGAATFGAGAAAGFIKSTTLTKKLACTSFGKSIGKYSKLICATAGAAAGIAATEVVQKIIGAFSSKEIQNTNFCIVKSLDEADDDSSGEDLSDFIQDLKNPPKKTTTTDKTKLDISKLAFFDITGNETLDGLIGLFLIIIVLGIVLRFFS